MKRLALILSLACMAAHCAAGAESPVDALFREAQAAFNAAKYDDAIAIYERVITEHPEVSDRWYTAEKSIVTTLIKKGDLAGAAQAAHLCMDGAQGLQTCDEATGIAAGILSAIDNNVDRANQLIAFQESGTAGGAVNPMDAIGYPSQPAREQAFATMRQQAGDNALASRLRAFTYLYSGKPREALAQFADAFRRSSGVTDLQRAGSDMVLIGLRDVHGHREGLDKAIQFVSYGPDGPDGKPGTTDDIADPFAGLIPEAPAPGEGGLAGMGADDIAALRSVRDAAQLYAADSFLRDDFRRGAFGALQRANDALDGWSPDKKDWYLEVAKKAGEYLFEAPYVGAQTGARGRALHFGGPRAMWAAIDADTAAQGIKPPRGMATAHGQFDSVCTALDKIKLPKPATKPLQKPVTFK